MSISEQSSQSTAPSIDFARVFDQAAVGVGLMTLESRWLQANAKACEILGYSHEQLLQHSCESLTLGEDLPHEAPLFKQLLAGEIEYYAVEKRCQRPDGSPTWINMTLSKVGAKTSTPPLLLVILEDINARKQAESALHNMEETHRLAMQATNDGLWDWDITNNRVYFSPMWSRIIGETEVPPDYSSWQDRIHPDDREHVLRSLQAHLDGDTQRWEEDHRLRSQSGEWLWVKGRGQVAKRDDSGKALRMVGTMIDISEQKQSEAMIWKQANYDSLTLLPNRKLFLELLNKEIAQCRRDRRKLWLMFIDVDDFKAINDTLGHARGDELLVKVTQRLKRKLRHSDILARLSGDEFVIALSSIENAADVDIVATQLMHQVGYHFELGGHGIKVTLSIGIACFPDDTDNLDDLLKFADQSMYAAKQSGKNRYTYFTSALQHAAQIRIQIAHDLRKALNNQEFCLFYQPVVKLRDNSVHKAEALIRWQHPQKGLYPPAAFIGFAEETGMINEIGRWVLYEAVHQLKNWQLEHDPGFQLSVNLSPRQMHARDSTFSDWMSKMQQLGLKRESIILEITEGLLLRGNAHINRQLLDFRDAGIDVAIDDFGTGYSSLAYLKEFSIDYLKIDRSFIVNLQPDSRELSICEAIIVMAHKLGLKVIAEGIETAEQRDLLLSIDCDFGQGYLFSKPVSAQDFQDQFFSASSPAQLSNNSSH